MNKWIRMIVLSLVILLTTSCGLFKHSSKVDGFCSQAAFIDTQEYKPVAPATTSDKEFHKVAGENVAKQHGVIRAYDSLRECWDYWIQK